MTANRIRGLIPAVCFLTCMTLVLGSFSPALAQTQTNVFTDLASFILATGLLTEIDFENLPPSASSAPPDLVASEFIPNPLILHGVTFTDPYLTPPPISRPASCSGFPTLGRTLIRPRIGP